MKKILFSIIALFLFFLSNMTVYARVEFDTANTAKGLLYITYDGALTKDIKLTVTMKGSQNNYTYTVRTNKKFSVPLQLGNGEYTARILEHVSGKAYRVLDQHQFSAEIQSPNDMFLAASPIVDYADEMTAIKEYDKILAGDGPQRTTTLYERVVNDYTYDDTKAQAISSGKVTGYVPVIDEVYQAKKGICFDYSAMMAGVLRDQGIPVKLVMGYSTEIDGYHAWNEILIGDRWVVVDTTYDSAYANAGQKYSMAKESKDFQVVKVY